MYFIKPYWPIYMHVFFFIYSKIFHAITNTFKIMLVINVKIKIQNHYFTVIIYVNEINSFLIAKYPHLTVRKQIKSA